ncbi:hypothetical protein B0T21DRAFT_418461 [Apiosordaria backusii]|uniref:Carboxylesterase family protein n=1 Tax=Apiosordaria backusii TaxID=314023 RepID=A0AA40EXZ2_9PEZI|nr:hypothetical protein B0T21DRAFT_418461 [Apiosordaria backusii]
MATTSRHRPGLDFDIHTDHNHLAQKASLPKFSVLGDLSLNSVPNLNSINIDALTRDLGNLHLEYPTKENNCQQQQPHQAQKAKGRRVRLSVDDNIEYDHPFSDKHRVVSGNTTTSASTSGSDDFEHNNPLALAKHRLPNNLEQIRKHQEGQFEWLLSIPIPIRKSHRGNRSLSDSHDGADQPQGEKKVLFGCNLIHNRTQSDGSLGNGDKPTNLYTLLATRVEGAEESIMEQSAIVEESESIIANVSQEEDSTILRAGESQTEAADTTHERPKSVLSIKVDEPLMTMDRLSPLPSPQPARPLSRIEDSVEELDKLEEELEALNEVAQLDRVVSPDPAPEPTLESIPETTIQQQAPPPTRRTTTVRASTTTTHSLTRSRSTAERSSSVRKSTSASSAGEDDKPKTAANTSTARRSITRPSSLLPPKAPVKSSRAPTVPAFELPGEAVARRLKEQRAARLSQQVSAEEAAAIAAQFSPSKPHVKSTKPVTRPTFELPGEAISRRKREEREAKLKAQEEEERKRREFKARPIRASVIGAVGVGSAVRETATSRARQARMEAAAANGGGNGGQATTPTHGHGSSATAPTSASAARKRHSIAAGMTSSYASSTVAASTRSVVSQTTTTTARGRTSLAAPGMGGAGSSSRGTSATSAASSNGKRSSTTTTVSQEEVQQQKLRGKEIFKRDNSYTSERERERKEREQAAKVAREQAAERSRALGREWKEKMAVRQKRASLMVSGGSGSQGSQG